MIPYFSFTQIALGPVTLHVWGMFLAVGFVIGALAAGWMAKKKEMQANIVYDLAPLLAVAGMLGGRIGHVLFYEPAYYAAHPLEAFAIWQGGLSVYGGLFACIAVGIWYVHYKKVDVHAYANVLVFGLPFGKVFGRLGCFFIHDHPGTLTHALLGVKYPDGEVRHDLGLYLAINALLMSLFFLVLARKPRAQGIYIVAFSMWYGTARFFLDFLRVVDVRYAGLTPGQYFSLALVGFGIFYALWIKKRVKKQETR